MLGSLFSGLASLGTGLFNFFGQKSAQEQQQQQFNQNIALQREFATSGIQMKVQDAIKAGLHPLAALGAQTSSFSPVSVNGSAPQLSESMGQDIGRALKAAMSGNDRAVEDESTARRLSLEKAGLENDILRAELASKVRRSSASGGMIGPPMPANTSVRIPLPRPGPDRTVSEGSAVKDEDIKQKAEDYPGTKIVRPFGYPLYANPWFNDGQQFEDRYGDSEIGSTIKFGVNTAADHAYTAYRRGLFSTRYKYPWYRGRR